MFDKMTTSRTVNISIVQDGIYEVAQFFYLNLTLPNQSNQRQKRFSREEGIDLGPPKEVTILNGECELNTLE